MSETVVISMSPAVQQKVMALATNLEVTKRNLTEIESAFQSLVIEPVVLVEEVPPFESVDLDVETNLVFKIEGQETYKVDLPASMKANVKTLADQRSNLLKTQEYVQSQLESFVQLVVAKDGTVSFETHKMSLKQNDTGVDLIAEPLPVKEDETVVQEVTE